MKDAMVLQDRVAMVTGAAGLLGSCVARELSRAGARLCLLDRDEAGLQAVDAALRAAGGLTLAGAVEVSRPAEVETYVAQVLRQWERLDILVTAVGTSPALDLPDSLLETPLAHWDRLLTGNLQGAFVSARAAVRAMLQADRGGRIIAIAPTVSNSSPHVLGEAVSGALITLTRGMALELQPYGISVNTLRPVMREGSPAGEAGQQVASMARYLAATAAPEVTGQTIIIGDDQRPH